MGQISIDQSHQVVATMTSNVDWSSVDFEKSGLQDLVIRNPKEAGRQFGLFLQNGGRVNVGGKLLIDRSHPFNPAEFIGSGWSIWRGPANGNGLEGEEEQDKRSIALTEVDLGGIVLDATLNAGETYITGEERISRLVAKDAIKMDAKIFQTLWENQKMIPEQLKEKTNGNTTFIFVDGTTLRGPDGVRFSLYFYWDAGSREWIWHYDWLGRGRYANDPSALLASSSLS